MANSVRNHAIETLNKSCHTNTPPQQLNSELRNRHHPSWGRRKGAVGRRWLEFQGQLQDIAPRNRPRLPERTRSCTPYAQGIVLTPHLAAEKVERRTFGQGASKQRGTFEPHFSSARQNVATLDVNRTDPLWHAKAVAIRHRAGRPPETRRPIAPPREKVRARGPSIWS